MCRWRETSSESENVIKPYDGQPPDDGQRSCMGQRRRHCQLSASGRVKCVNETSLNPVMAEVFPQECRDRVELGSDGSFAARKFPLILICDM